MENTEGRFSRFEKCISYYLLFFVILLLFLFLLKDTNKYFIPISIVFSVIFVLFFSKLLCKYYPLCNYLDEDYFHFKNPFANNYIHHNDQNTEEIL